MPRPPPPTSELYMAPPSITVELPAKRQSSTRMLVEVEKRAAPPLWAARILATHIVSDIELIANEVILLRDGRIARDGSTKSLLTEVEGKVWEWTVPETMIDSVLKTYRVGNMYREGDRVTARIVGDTAPDPGCVSVPATLEDAFLYFCGADGDGTDQR